MAEGSIRVDRTRKFLITHGVLCGLAFLATSVETLSGVQTSFADIVRSYAISVIGGAMTLAAVKLYRRPAWTRWVAPAILAVDSALVLVQMLLEAGLESGWAATPVLLTVLLPLYTDDRRAILGLTGLQLALYTAIFGLRAAGMVDYEPRVEGPESIIYSGLGFLFVVVGAAVFANQASLDVLNSQERLQREIDAATAALRAAQAQIVQQAKMAGLGSLTAGVAHEINNPLTFVQTNLTSIERDMADMLRLYEAMCASLPALAAVAPAETAPLVAVVEEVDLDPELGAMLPELIQDTQDGLSRVQRIIADLRTFSRSDTSHRVEQPLDRALDEAIEIFQRECDDAEVVRAYTPIAPVPVYPLLLNQVIINLLRNACDAVPAEGGRITIRLRAQGDAAIIEVEDNGPGVAPEVRDRIFEPFFTTKEVGQGTGLGLAISYQILEHHRGTIELVDREPGACFRLRLPLT
ncbi:MAG: HAMP domain-containing histidine kinase [Myxococcales bacterium]|nr:HAMP domain-containing histidine kinase [Myxococcales bacterium]